MRVVERFYDSFGGGYLFKSLKALQASSFLNVPKNHFVSLASHYMHTFNIINSTGRSYTSKEVCLLIFQSKSSRRIETRSNQTTNGGLHNT